MENVPGFFAVIPKQKAFLLSPIALAFAGDSCYSLYVRCGLVASGFGNAKLANKEANSFVNAVSQALLYDSLAGYFAEDEADVARRARNAHTANIAKNATIEQYKKATSLEAVLGYLFLSGDYQRIGELLCRAQILPGNKR